MKKLFFLLIIPFAVLMVSCSDDTSESDSNSSASSHNTGKNCLGCHSFKIAGSVYDTELTSAYKGATITITTEAGGQGTVLATLTSDKTGNYYSNSSISYGSGVYAGVKGTSGTIKYMEGSITSGACNLCHNGSTTSKVWAE